MVKVKRRGLVRGADWKVGVMGAFRAGESAGHWVVGAIGDRLEGARVMKLGILDTESVDRWRPRRPSGAFPKTNRQTVRRTENIGRNDDSNRQEWQETVRKRKGEVKRARPTLSLTPARQRDLLNREAQLLSFHPQGKQRLQEQIGRDGGISLLHFSNPRLTGF